MEFEKIETRHWVLTFTDGWTFDLNLVSSSMTNKYHIIADFLTDMSVICRDFEPWLQQFLHQYTSDKENSFDYLKKSVPEIKRFVNMYTEEKNFDYDQYVDETKAKKSSILFKADEIKCIIILSSYLKTYALISNSTDLKIDQRIQCNQHDVE